MTWDLFTELELSLRCKLKIHSLLFSVLFVIGCPNVMEDPDPPERPSWVEKSLPESEIEIGIDAASRDRIVLMWHPNYESDLAGYTIFRADTTIENGFEELVSIDLIQSTSIDTQFFDENVNTYIQYFYFIRAYDNADNASSPSDTISYMLLRSPRIEHPIDESVDSLLTLEWMDRADAYIYSSEYVLRIEKLNDGIYQHYWICRMFNQWYGYENTEPIVFSYFPSNSTLQPENVILAWGSTSYPSSGNYRWKVKAISEVDNQTNRDEASGESDWGFFEVE